MPYRTQTLRPPQAPLRLRILAGLLGLASAVGASALPKAPDRGERYRHERLAVFGRSAAGWLTEGNIAHATIAMAHGLGAGDSPSQPALNASGMRFCDCALGQWVDAREHNPSWGQCGDGFGGNCAHGSPYSWSEGGCDPSRCHPPAWRVRRHGTPH